MASAVTIKPQSFGAKVRAARRAIEMTQTALGRAIGCNASHVCGIELGYTTPSPEEQKRIARVLKLSIPGKKRQ